MPVRCSVALGGRGPQAVGLNSPRTSCFGLQFIDEDTGNQLIEDVPLERLRPALPPSVRFAQWDELQVSSRLAPGPDLASWHASCTQDCKICGVRKLHGQISTKACWCKEHAPQQQPAAAGRHAYLVQGLHVLPGVQHMTGNPATLPATLAFASQPQHMSKCTIVCSFITTASSTVLYYMSACAVKHLRNNATPWIVRCKPMCPAGGHGSGDSPR
jgi:hypothetical protein